jgi:hypothetical protein
MILGATGFGAGLTVGLAVGAVGAGLVVVAAGFSAITGMFAVSSPPEVVELVTGWAVVLVVTGAVVLGAVLTVVGVAGAVLTIGSGTGAGGF